MMFKDPNSRTHFGKPSQSKWESTDPLLAFANDFRAAKCEWNEVLPQMTLKKGDLIYVEGNTWTGFLSEVESVEDSWVTVLVRYTPPKRGSDLNRQFRIRRSSVKRVVNIVGC